MDLLLETIKRTNYKDMNIIYVAYLDSIGWNFDGPAPGREVLYGMDSPLARTLSAYHKGLRPPRGPEKRSRNMELFKIAEKEYLDSLGPKEPGPVEFPNECFCSEGCEHQFIGINGKRTCCKCGLEDGPTHYVSGFGCWDRAIMRSKPTTVESKVYGFIKRKGVSGYELFGRGSPYVVNRIVSVCESEKSDGGRLPNLNIISYQVCKRLGVEADWSLLRILRGRFPTTGVGKYLRH
jgi:hypothetical protein